MIMLDSNICIYIINKRPPRVLERFRQYRAGELALSSIVASELAFGVEKRRSDRHVAALELFLLPFEILPFDERCVWHYARIRAGLESKGRVIGAMDTLIAAHALALDVPIATNHVKEFARVPGLKVQHWV